MEWNIFWKNLLFQIEHLKKINIKNAKDHETS
jgi:hypothetical protein